jgi:hypothetical protein
LAGFSDGTRPEIPLDAAIARVAGRQHGLVTLDQLGECGLGARGVRHRVAAGRLHRVHRGVFAVGHRALSLEATFLAAVLAVRPPSLLSYRASGAMWGVRKWRRGDVDVTVVGRDARSRRAIRVHQVPELWEDDIAERDGIPLTSPARTILDLAGVLSLEDLKWALAQAEIDGRLTHAQLRRQLDRHPRAKGRRTLERILDLGEQRFRSELEREVSGLISGEGRRVNRIVGGKEVDLYFPDRKLIVEVDSERFHRTPTKLLLDDERDRHHERMGLEVLRVSQTTPGPRSGAPGRLPNG